MSLRAPLAAGAILSFAVTAAWSWMASLTIGPAAPLHLSRDLPSDYAQLASAATGNGAELFAVVAFIFFACFLAVGWRQREKGGGA
jgi:hypothetical protein